MSIKHDRTAPRTVEDMERKYNFGKKFSEILGLIDESRDKVDSVESSLRNEITETATKLSRNTEEIVMQATKDVRTEIKEDVDELDTRITEVHNEVEMKVDAHAVNIAIEERMLDGIDQVETATGYRFDANGLNISKSGEEMVNRFDNTGMYVTRAGEEILTANNKGVTAANLHAKTGLILGSDDGRSRIEDYGIDRVGVFWLV